MLRLPQDRLPAALALLAGGVVVPGALLGVFGHPAGKRRTQYRLGSGMHQAQGGAVGVQQGAGLIEQEMRVRVRIQDLGAGRGGKAHGPRSVVQEPKYSRPSAAFDSALGLR